MSDDLALTTEQRAEVQAAELQFLMSGDLAGLSDAQIVYLYKTLCQGYGWDWLTRPFDLLPRQEGDQQTLRLYPNRVAAALLAKDHGLSVEDIGERWDWEAGLYFAFARATDGTRHYDDAGVVAVVYQDNQTGELKRYSPRYLADRIKTARTQAHRRAVLGWCGLARADSESEMSSVPGTGAAVDIYQASEKPSEPRKLTDEGNDTLEYVPATRIPADVPPLGTLQELRAYIGKKQGELRALGVRYPAAPKATGDAGHDLNALRYYAATLGNLVIDNRPAAPDAGGFMTF